MAASSCGLRNLFPERLAALLEKDMLAYLTSGERKIYLAGLIHFGFGVESERWIVWSMTPTLYPLWMVLLTRGAM